MTIDPKAAALNTPGDAWFDVSGVCSIRLRGARPADVAIVSRQLGRQPVPAPQRPRPDLTIAFHDRLETRGVTRFLGLGEAGFTDDAFLVLRGAAKAPVRVSIPFATLGGACELECERGRGPVPLLVAIVNLTILGRDVVPVHASAFQYDGVGVLVGGWAKGGKTETLLSFMRRGARYIGDEWVYVLPDGRITGLPQPIRLWKWHLDQLPDARTAVSRRARLRLEALQTIAGRAPDGRDRPAIVRRVQHAAGRQLHVQVAPTDLFGPHACLEDASLDRVFLAMSTEVDTYDVVPADPVDVARRLAHSIQYERAGLLAAYRQFRFAFPDTANEAIETSLERETRLLETALVTVPAFTVSHPYPFAIDRIFEVMSPRIEGTRARPARGAAGRRRGERRSA